MPLENPSLRQLNNRIVADIDEQFKTQNIQNTAHKKLATALAGLTYGLYNYAESASKQISPFFAEDEYLENWLNLYGITPRLAARATGVIYCTSTTNITIPINSLFTNPDGFKYKTTEAKTLTANEISDIQVEAMSDGAEYNVYRDLTLEADNIGGLKATTSIITGGVSAETTEDMRARLIETIRSSGCTGSAADFERWARQISGIGKAYCNPVINEAGYIVLYVASTNVFNPQISATLASIVQSDLEIYKPITAKAVLVLSVTAAYIDLTIKTTHPSTSTEEFEVKNILANSIYKNFSFNSYPTVAYLQTVVDEAVYRVSINSIGKGDFATLRNITWVIDTNG